MAKIFISYRRQYDSYLVTSLGEDLRERFGEDSVFVDTDDIPGGADFKEVLAEAVAQCDVLLVIISKQWATGRRRLTNEADYVRIEIESAMARNIHVVPVLLDKAKMPELKDLPESLQKFAFRQWIDMRSGPDYKRDVDQLIKELEEHFEAKSKESEKKNLKVFISYRRPANQIHAAFLAEKIRERFGDSAVFSDVDQTLIHDIHLRKNLSDIVGQCDVLLALIGREWVFSATGRMIGEPLSYQNNYVRTAIELAFEREVPVIPVLLENVEMPVSEIIPESLKKITYRQAYELREGAHFSEDVDRLIQILEKGYATK
jgi:hypothetical protein